MKYLGFDLRCLHPSRFRAGIAHATQELWDACQKEAKDFGITCVSKPPFDAFFGSTGTIPFRMKVPTFPWVHDLAIFSHPEWFPQSWIRRQYTTRKFLHGLKKAQHIFCVSEDTKKSVEERLTKIRPMSVTREGVNLPSTYLSYHERQDQLLVFGTVEPRKNISFLLDLWADVCRRVIDRPLRLMIAGQNGWGKGIFLSDPSIVRLQNIADSERNLLFQQSRLVLVPSLHEGFGRVALEAMAHGTPVIASDGGAHPEIVGDGGMLIDPTDRERWIATIIKLLTDQQTWEAQQRQGRLQAKKFDWKTVARHILAVISKNC